MYDYKVTGIRRVIDGDTFDFDVSLGFFATIRIRVRLAGIDTPEIFGRNSDLPRGREARDFAAKWLHEHEETLAVRTKPMRRNTPIGQGGFGRWLGEVYDRETGELLADALREAGYEKGAANVEETEEQPEEEQVEEEMESVAEAEEEGEAEKTEEWEEKEKEEDFEVEAEVDLEEDEEWEIEKEFDVDEDTDLEDR